MPGTALAGCAKVHTGRTYAVAAIVNHPEAASATPFLDGVIEWIAANGDGRPQSAHQSQRARGRILRGHLDAPATMDMLFKLYETRSHAGVVMV